MVLMCCRRLRSLSDKGRLYICRLFIALVPLDHESSVHHSVLCKKYSEDASNFESPRTDSCLTRMSATPLEPVFLLVVLPSTDAVGSRLDVALGVPDARFLHRLHIQLPRSLVLSPALVARMS